MGREQDEKGFEDRILCGVGVKAFVDCLRAWRYSLLTMGHGQSTAHPQEGRATVWMYYYVLGGY